MRVSTSAIGVSELEFDFHYKVAGVCEGADQISASLLTQPELPVN